jgi:hypothetical protein
MLESMVHVRNGLGSSSLVMSENYMNLNLMINNKNSNLLATV